MWSSCASRSLPRSFIYHRSLLYTGNVGHFNAISLPCTGRLWQLDIDHNYLWHFVDGHSRVVCSGPNLTFWSRKSIRRLHTLLTDLKRSLTTSLHISSIWERRIDAFSLSREDLLPYPLCSMLSSTPSSSSRYPTASFHTRSLEIAGRTVSKLSLAPADFQDYRGAFCKEASFTTCDSRFHLPAHDLLTYVPHCHHRTQHRLRRHASRTRYSIRIPRNVVRP